jgi:hypothetical protein
MDQPKHEQPARDLPGEVAYFLALWRNVHRPPPPRLSHYTDAAGLCGIVRSGSLWATHIYYLNDSLEFKYGSQVINNIFTHEIDSSQGQITQRLRRLQECYQGHFAIWESLADPYVVCFCEAGNLLSQWRAYATNGSGFAIEFEPARLIQALERDPEISENSKLLKVLYDDNEQRQFTKLAIDQLVKAFDAHPEQEVLDSVPLVFSEMSLCFKHRAFAEEDEWRLVFMPRTEGFVDVRVREGRLLPYASVHFGDPNERPPYSTIVHGPTLEAENTKRAIKMLLGKTNKYWDLVVITGSDAPLRSR